MLAAHAPPDPALIISERKSAHLALCAAGAAEFEHKTTLLEQVELIHEALPDMSLDSVRLDTPLFGKVLGAPVVISAMTGGTPAAAAINRDLAMLAEELGLGFGLGSQRAMVLRPECSSTFVVRDVAPSALIMGNIGVVQARQMATAELERMLQLVGADALCVHLNPAMELVQPGGDRDFAGCSETIVRLVRELPVPVVIKETGCGMSRRTATRLRDLGVRAVDVSGAGGTSWVAVEAQRAEGAAAELGRELWDWGIPTAACVAALADLGLEIVATGGLRCAKDACAALALGARAAGYAAPVLRAYTASGIEGARSYLRQLVDGIRAITFLTGCRSSGALAQRPALLSPLLRAWVAALHAA